jgi:hypothetical protein
MGEGKFLGYIMTKGQVEIFTAECPLCNETVQLVQELTCSSCEVSIYDLRESGSMELSKWKVRINHWQLNNSNVQNDD